MSITPQSFFNRPAQIVARELLGKYLVREYRGRRIVAAITETEAYIGPHDLASHASKGLTPRNAPMFGPPGHWYVYFIYGMHWMLNVVTGKEGYPAAVLIRGCVAINGPGKLTKYFHIDKRQNGMPVAKSSRLWIEDRGVVVRSKNIIRAPRVGVSYAGPKWSNAPYRFALIHNNLYNR